MMAHTLSNSLKPPQHWGRGHKEGNDENSSCLLLPLRYRPAKKARTAETSTSMIRSKPVRVWNFVNSMPLILHATLLLLHRVVHRQVGGESNEERGHGFGGSVSPRPPPLLSPLIPRTGRQIRLLPHKMAGTIAGKW